jgi:hypothetical protein
LPEKFASVVGLLETGPADEIALGVDRPTDPGACGVRVLVAWGDAGMMISGAGLGIGAVSGISKCTKEDFDGLLPPFLTTTKLPTATTSTAAAARHAARLYHLTGLTAGTTPRAT